MKDECVLKTENQIKLEITASLNYLSMGAFFSNETVNRPGFAKLFFEAASEEREHAYKLIEYLSMRGRYLNLNGIGDIDISQLVKDSENPAVTGIVLGDIKTVSAGTTRGLVALQNALKLETHVTKSIRALIKTCEEADKEVDRRTNAESSFNHFHVSL